MQAWSRTIRFLSGDFLVCRDNTGCGETVPTKVSAENGAIKPGDLRARTGRDPAAIRPSARCRRAETNLAGIRCAIHRPDTFMKRKPKPQPRILQGLLVLVVEDHDDSRYILEESLKYCGAVVKAV